MTPSRSTCRVTKKRLACLLAQPITALSTLVWLATMRPPDRRQKWRALLCYGGRRAPFVPQAGATVYLRVSALPAPDNMRINNRARSAPTSTIIH